MLRTLAIVSNQIVLSFGVFDSFLITKAIQEWGRFLYNPRSPFYTYYISFRSSGSQESNTLNGVQIGAKTKKLWPFEDNRTKLKDNFTSCEMGFGLWNFRITWCGCLQMAITSSFQLQFMHHLKRWTPNFLSFETTYSRNEMDSREYSKYVQQLLSYWILHVRFLCFSSLHPWFGFGKGLQSSKAWILHVNGLPFAFPWIL